MQACMWGEGMWGEACGALHRAMLGALRAAHRALTTLRSLACMHASERSGWLQLPCLARSCTCRTACDKRLSMLPPDPAHPAPAHSSASKGPAKPTWCKLTPDVFDFVTKHLYTQRTPENVFFIHESFVPLMDAASAASNTNAGGSTGGDGSSGGSSKGSAGQGGSAADSSLGGVHPQAASVAQRDSSAGAALQRGGGSSAGAERAAQQQGQPR